MSNRVVHFEIHADKPERAIMFYKKVFDWKIHKWGEIEYWLITTGNDDEPGINGGLMPRMGDHNGEKSVISSYICTIDVSSLDDSIKAVAENGGKIVKAKREIKGVGWVAFAKDTEGNIFGIMQAETS
jgi:predicted enzyme related to lactoylglutathione lyase